MHCKEPMMSRVMTRVSWCLLPIDCWWSWSIEGNLRFWSPFYSFPFLLNLFALGVMVGQCFVGDGSCHMNWGAPQVAYTSSPYVMPGAASISAMPMTSYTTGMPMTYSTWDARDGLWSNLGLNSTQSNLLGQLGRLKLQPYSRSHNHSKQKYQQILLILIVGSLNSHHSFLYLEILSFFWQAWGLLNFLEE